MTTNAQPVSSWHVLTIDDTLERVGSAAGGLSTPAARARLTRDGPNTLPAPRPTPLWRLLLRQLFSVITLLLIAAAAIALLSGDRFDALAILAVLVINVMLGLATEVPARRAMSALLSQTLTRATVLRDGTPQDVDARELVVGDVIVLEAGQAVPADSRLLEAVEARTVEAALTGEAAAVRKESGATLPTDTPLAERRNMIFCGTTLVEGAARACVVATGAHTEVGRIGVLLKTLPYEMTPLERRLDVLGRRLALSALAVAVVVALLESLQGGTWTDVLELALALGVAAVPEGLPVVATVTLAIGMRRMARRRALVRRLAVVETLGSTTIVCTDKTGTLTTGQMTATTLHVDGSEIAVTGAGYTPHGVFHERGAPLTPAERPLLDLALRIGLLASRPDLALPADDEPPAGDPTEVALLVAARKAGLEPARVRADAGALVGQIPFASTRRYMAVHYRRPDGTLVAYLKGAPDRVAARCALDADAQRQLEETNRSLAIRGLRLLGLAYGPVADTSAAALQALTFAGFVGLADPPAPGVEAALHTLRDAGIRTVMLTGDQRHTAEAIARRLDVLRPGDETIDGREVDAMDDAALAARVEGVAAFSRVTPEAKLRIVAAFQRRGEIVAMLGDGVNDTPALAKADIGVAMGRRGTDLAKATAGLVLQDDQFETVGSAVEEGRVIFDNLRKFVFYLFSCNLGEIFVFLGAGLMGWPPPLLPLQILWLNIVTDTFPALALAFEPAEPNLMRRPPRSPREAILAGPRVRDAVGYAALIAICTLAAAWWGTSTGLAPNRTATLVFMTLAIAEALHLGNARSDDAVLRPARMTANRHAIGALGLVILLQILTVQWPPLAAILRTSQLTPADWVVAGVLGSIPAVAGQLTRALGTPVVNTT
ncbi:MAG TPA: cation-transporting P-type ATPase [Gemmatimonadales bacterium]